MSMKRIAAIVFLAICAACQKDSTPYAGPAGPGALPPEEAKPVKVKFEASCGDFVVEVQPAWAPLGAKRFLELVKIGFYDGCRFFRVAPNFVVQFGINGDPKLDSRWADKWIPDDPVRASNKERTICFATSGPNTRSTQLFINLKNNGRLDAMGFAAFGQVVEGWETVQKISSKYEEQPGKDQGRIHAEGNAFLDNAYPGLDYIKKATILP